MARACGISIVHYKSKCFLVAAFTAGIAGSLYAHHARYLNPNDFTFNKSIEILIMVVVGGLGATWCCHRRYRHCPDARSLAFFRRTQLILFGALVVVLMGVSRGGIAGLAPILVNRISRYRGLSAGKRLECPKSSSDERTPPHRSAFMSVRRPDRSRRR